MSIYRLIPSIDQLLAREGVRTLVARFGHDAVVDALRSATAHFRSTVAVTPDSSLDPDAIMASLETDAAARVEQSFRPSLRRVINATGVVIHTNLGRAPLAEAAA